MALVLCCDSTFELKFLCGFKKKNLVEYFQIIDIFLSTEHELRMASVNEAKPGQK